MRVMIVTPDAGDGPWERIMRSRVDETLTAFQDLGATSATITPLSIREDPDGSLRRIIDFKPDLLTAPNYNYWLLAASGNPAFFDLPFPTLAPWDDPLGALANQAMHTYAQGGWEERPVERRGWFGWLFGTPTLTAPAFFDRLTANSAVLHVGWDTGHMKAFRSLGLARRQTVHWEPVPVSRQFIAHGRKPGRKDTIYDVGFCGNIYDHSMTRHPLWQDEFTRGLALRAADGKERDLERSVWDLLLEQLEAIPLSERREKGLTADRRPFWELYLFLAWTVLNTEVRLRVLTSVRRPVHIFGMFADPASVASLAGRGQLRYAGSADYFSELPRTYASIKINVCHSNGLIYRGTPAKLLDCIASGGFALCDPKPDVVRLLGPAAEKIFFRDAAELNDKIEYYLDRPAEREQLVRHFQPIIAERCNLGGYYGRVLPLLGLERRAA